MIDIKFDYSNPRAKIIENTKKTIEEIENLKNPAINDEEFIKKYSNVFFNENAYKYMYCMPARHNRASEYKEFNKNTQEFIDDVLNQCEQLEEIYLIDDIIDIYNHKYKDYEEYINHVKLKDNINNIILKDNKFVYAGKTVIQVISKKIFYYLFCKRNLKTNKEVES